MPKDFLKILNIFLDKSKSLGYNKEADFGDAEIIWPYGGVTQLVE